jgi:hypothetical protein
VGTKVILDDDDDDDDDIGDLETMPFLGRKSETF